MNPDPRSRAISANKLAFASTLMAVVSLFFGGILLSGAGIIVAGIGKSKRERNSTRALITSSVAFVLNLSFFIYYIVKVS